MPEQKWLMGGLIFTLALALTACNSGSSSDPATDEDTPTDNLLEPGPNEALLYYKRPDASYEGWGLHLWNDTGAGCDGLAEGVPTEWDSPRLADGISNTYGAYYLIPMREAGNCLNFIMHKGDDKDLGGQDHRWHLDALGNRIFTINGSPELSSTPLETDSSAIKGASAHWVDANTLVFLDTDNLPRVELRYDYDAKIAMAESGQLEGGKSLSLTPATLSQATADKFPHLAGWPAYEVHSDTDTAASLLKSQLVAAAYNHNDELVIATGVQIPGVLDDLFTYSGELGANVNGSDVNFAVWAPTAQNMKLHVFDSVGTLLPGFPKDMVESDGVWKLSGSRNDLLEKYYQYEVTVYHPETGAVETRLVSDPYALSLSTNGQYAQVVDLETDYKPSGWDSLSTPSRPAPEDIVVYEVHIRDFSATDETIEASLRGKLKAFTQPADGSVDSVDHLKAMADAGVTHLHLLPAFDIATVNEDPSETVNLEDDFARLCSLSSAAATNYASHCQSGQTIREVLEDLDSLTGDTQALYNTFRDLDSFNWGYDPVHFTVPDGSYATDAEGAQRILEFREMVSAATALGLNVVLDVVYNHTNASGLSQNSILDKLVPGYYHRQNPETGTVEQSTCCENTASEHAMMEKLMIDSLVTWVRHYKISGFRFDLMGHHMLSNMKNALAAVHTVDPGIYFYGEAWNFGEVENNARGKNAIQANMAGTGIGSFNDRQRDAVRGGGPFDGGDAIRSNQGFANGLFTIPNDRNSGSSEERDRLLQISDWIRIGIAGSLADYQFETATDELKTGAQIDYNGQAAGYTQDPQEIINYVSKHDNQTLWDNNQYKTAYTASTMERAQMQVVGLAIPILSQGIPFLHMGSELLRSKSMERDSYDSGDWFNEVDFSYQTSAWNRGLPRQDKDGANWDLITEVITSAGHKAAPDPTAISYTRDQVLALLEARKSSPLFRLETAQAIKDRLTFLNTGSQQIPGLIAFSLGDGPDNGLANLDSDVAQILVVINSTGAGQTLDTSLTDTFTVMADTSPDQTASAVNGSFTVPALSVAIFNR